jgi:hypothetical protein
MLRNTNNNTDPLLSALVCSEIMLVPCKLCWYLGALQIKDLREPFLTFATV